MGAGCVLSAMPPKSCSEDMAVFALWESRAHRLRDFLLVMDRASAKEVGKRELSLLGLGKLVDRDGEVIGHLKDFPQLGDMCAIPRDFRPNHLCILGYLLRSR